MAFLGGLFKDVPATETGLSDLEQLTRAAQGNLSGTMSSGDKLIALSQLMRSATRSGRRAGLTPGSVVSGLREQQMGAIQNRMAIEQLKASAARKAKQDAAWAFHVSNLSPDKQQLVEGYTDEQRSKALMDAADPQPFAMTERGGEQFMVFRGGTQLKIEGLPRDVERVGDANHGYKFYYKGTTDPVIDPNTGKPKFIPGEISPVDAAQLAQGQQRINQSAQEFQYRKTHPGSSGGGKEAKDIWITGPDGKAIKVRGISLGGNSYNVNGRVFQAVPSPQGATDRGL